MNQKEPFLRRILPYLLNENSHMGLFGPLYLLWHCEYQTCLRWYGLPAALLVLAHGAFGWGIGHKLLPLVEVGLLFHARLRVVDVCGQHPFFLALAQATAHRPAQPARPASGVRRVCGRRGAGHRAGLPVVICNPARLCRRQSKHPAPRRARRPFGGQPYTRCTNILLFFVHYFSRCPPQKYAILKKEKSCRIFAAALCGAKGAHKRRKGGLHAGR